MADLRAAALVDRGVGPVVRPGVPVEIAPGVVRLTASNASMMTGPGTNTYLIGEGRLVVLDPGPDDAQHRSRIVEAIDGREVLAVAVTHTHPDHAPGATPLARVLDAPRAGFAPGPSFEPDLVLADGDELGEAPFTLRVLHTPGHASAHCCFLFGAQRLAFTGDHVMHGSTVVIRPPDGDVGAYLESLRSLAGVEPALEILAPGHGRLIGDPAAAIAEVISHRTAREAIVLEMLANQGPATAAQLAEVVYPGIEAQRRDVATATLWAHLRHLVDRGLVIPSEMDHGADEITSRFEVVS